MFYRFFLSRYLPINNKNQSRNNKKLKKITLTELTKRLKKNNRIYRVGATNHLDPNIRIRQYKEFRKCYKYYSPTENTKYAENQLLKLLPKNHKYNVQKQSNMSGKRGHVYIIDTTHMTRIKKKRKLAKRSFFRKSLLRKLWKYFRKYIFF